MPSSQLQHRRTHNLLLISKLLNNREDVSPFTLVVDSLEQSGKPLVREYIRRANASKARVIFVSFETSRKLPIVDIFIPATAKNLSALQKEIISHLTTAGTRNLLILDSLNVLCSAAGTDIPSLLSSLISPTTSLLAVYHLDVPVNLSQKSPYSSEPLTLLKYLSTTIFTTHSLSHILAQKSARDRSLASPVFGLAEEIEGIVVGLGSNDRRGIVVEMEHRRKSGRGVKEWFFLPTPVPAVAVPSPASIGTKIREHVVLLVDHPFYRQVPSADAVGAAIAGESMDTTFNLGLTDKQRSDREGVVLPYFDAQREEGMGEGGRILYDMGEEDDFDEEEDETVDFNFRMGAFFTQFGILAQDDTQNINRNGAETLKN